MLTAITLAAVLSTAPAQAGTLNLTNVRPTIGELGPTRDNTKLLPGDILFVAYEIDGLAVDEQGVAHYLMAMEVSDADGKLIFKQDPRESFDFVALRGNKLPARAYITVGLDQPPGNYTCKISVTDPKTKATGGLNVKFEVLKKEFAVVAVFTSHDEDGNISAPTTGQVGQTVFVQYSVAAFERDPKTKQPNVEVRYQIYDEKGKPIFVDADGKQKPLKRIQDANSANPVKEGAGAFVLKLPVFMSRPGKYVVEITAIDNASATKKQSVYKLPITINPAN